MGMARYLVEAHLLEGRPVAELAASHGVHRSWIYKLIARYRAEGEAGLMPRSRRPQRSPSRTSQAFVSEILALRKQLGKDGFDAGAETIHTHLARKHERVPSAATIWRLLRAEGLVTPSRTSDRAAPTCASARSSPTSSGRATSPAGARSRS